MEDCNMSLTLSFKRFPVPSICLWQGSFFVRKCYADNEKQVR